MVEEGRESLCFPTCLPWLQVHTCSQLLEGTLRPRTQTDHVPTSRSSPNFAAPSHISTEVEAYTDSCYLAFFPQVVGLVTRKDLARYRLGKGGLEELSLAQT